MKLEKILSGVDYTCENFENQEISDIVYDSRKAVEGTIFVCLVGVNSDAHSFAQSAYEKGCRVFICEKSVNLPSDAMIIFTENTRSTLADISCNFFNHPSKELCVVAITGTKGKTTIANLVKSVFENSGIVAGSIGTIGAWYADIEIPTVNTTPESYEFQKILRTMADGGCKVVAIEASSLGLKHHRVQGTHFEYGVFTNFSPDHVGTNEHDSLEEYGYWKTELFPMCKKAIVNIDDEFSPKVLEKCSGEVTTYGVHENADYQLIENEITQNDRFLGTRFKVVHGEKIHEYELSLIGEVNSLNSLVALALAHEFGLEDSLVRKALAQVRIKGRSELIKVTNDIFVIIDYAHNGISIQTLIDTLRQYDHGKIVTVVGCVGGRAECRREEVGLTLGALSDFSVLTSDDPNFEDPMKIATEIGEFVQKSDGKFVKIPDRGEAIHYVIENAQAGDIIILAGKGHEQYMKINGIYEPFSERLEVEKAMKKFIK